MANIDGLVEVYGKKCMLTGIKKELSYHHIIKKCDGGPLTNENGGILFTGIHQWLHNYGELYNEEVYNETNLIICEYKKLFIERPIWFSKWVLELNKYYLEICKEYYYNKHDTQMVRKLTRYDNGRCR